MKGKSVAIVILLVVAAITYDTTTHGAFWPALPFSIALGVILLVSISYIGDRSPLWLLAGCVLFGLHALIGIAAPETLTYIDPDKYAVWATQIIETGDIQRADTIRYTNLPVFLAQISMTALIVDTPAATAMLIVPIAMAVLVPIVTAWYVSIFTRNSILAWPATSAGLCSGVLAITISFSHTPIAMVLATLFLLVSIPPLVRAYFVENRVNPRFLIIIIVLWLAVLYSHTFIMLLVTIMTLTLTAFNYRMSPEDRFEPTYLIPAVVAFVFLVVQWFVVSRALSLNIFRLSLILTEPFAQTLETQPVPAGAASPIFTGFTGIFFRRVHGFVLGLMGALGWVTIALTNHGRKFSPQVSLLVIAATLAAFLPVALIVPKILNPVRVVLVTEPLLLSLSVAGGAVIISSTRGMLRETSLLRYTVLSLIALVVLLLLSVLLASQVISAPIATDHPASYRAYLTDEEASGKEWGHDYHADTISADPFLAHERPRPQRHVNDNGSIDTTVSTRYRTILEPYLNRSIRSGCPDRVLYRDIDVYRSQGAYVLTWNPRPTLKRTYSMLYTSGNVQHFADPRCTDQP